MQWKEFDPNWVPFQHLKCRKRPVGVLAATRRIPWAVSVKAGGRGSPDWGSLGPCHDDDNDMYMTVEGHPGLQPRSAQKPWSSFVISKRKSTLKRSYLEFLVCRQPAGHLRWLSCLWWLWLGRTSLFPGVPPPIPTREEARLQIQSKCLKLGSDRWQAKKIIF